jgi:glycosyltransferase involved in cell wall biosynthesis
MIIPRLVLRPVERTDCGLRVAMLPMLPRLNAATRAFCERPLHYLGAHGISGRLFEPSSNRLYRWLQHPQTRWRRPLAALYWYGLVLPQRLGQLVQVLGYDIIFIQRGLLRHRSPPVLEAVLWFLAGRLLGRLIVFHCDDALHAVVRPNWYRARCRMADWVVTGSDEVASFARTVNPNVWRFGAPIEVDRYPVKRHHATAPVTIGWVGNHAEECLMPVVAALARVCQQRRARVKVISDRPFEPPQLGDQVVWEPWSLDRRFSLFAELDIGIMPLMDTPYDRGKEAYKLKEYMAAGIPVVCSPVGQNREVVEHATVGYFARTEQEWVEHLVRLIDDADLRASLGSEGRRLAEARYAFPLQARRLAAFLWAIAGAGNQVGGGRDGGVSVSSCIDLRLECPNDEETAS